jgi:cysteine desulfurase
MGPARVLQREVGVDGVTGARRAYLDHAATTPLRPEALDAMEPYLTATVDVGNPSGTHTEARRARRAVDDARDQLAALVGADFGEIVFTSGGTEADNLAVFGSATGPPSPDGTLVCTAIEHEAVLAACRARAEHAGAPLREVAVGKDGIVDLDALDDALGGDVVFVSVMAVNNEVGTIQPLGAVAERVRRRAPSAVLHTDAVQAAPWSDLPVHAAPADLVAISAHKFGGPKGIGALVVRKGTTVRPLLFGGGQERDRRSGTTNVAGVVGMAAALTATVRDREATNAAVARRRDRLAHGLLRAVPGSAETGDPSARTPGHLHMRFAGVEGEALVLLLDDAGVAVSAGSSCSSGATEPSHVLVAMGFDADEAASGVRFSLGPITNDGDIDLALATVPDAVARLRG